MRTHEEVQSARQFAGRSRFIEIMFGVAFVLIILRLYYWQIIRAESLQAIADAQYGTQRTLKGSRGTIFSADGYPLVVNKPVFRLYVEPIHLTAPIDHIANTLAPLFAQLSYEDDQALYASSSAEVVLEQLQKEWTSSILDRLQKKSPWVSVKNNIPLQVKDDIEQLSIDGLGFEEQEARLYPEASLSAQILGFVGKNQEGEDQGYFGVEGFFDRELRPRSGLSVLEKDALGNPLSIGTHSTIGARNGRDIQLTLRRDIQFLLEEHLKRGMEKYGSKTAEGVIMDPATGKIIAMASFPSYDPEKYYQYPPETYSSLLANDVYEPGSTMKIFTVASGIDAGVIQPDSVCPVCDGPRKISGFTIKTWNNEYYPNSTITDGLVHSDNTVMIHIAELLGKDKFLDYMKKFHLFEKTTIELREETIAPERKTWREIDIATASFGQGVAMNGLQMVQIAQIIANKGLLVQPTLLESMDDEGTVMKQEAKVGERVISEETAWKVTEMMEQSAAHGDAKWAIPKGYRIAGKTGTAQIPVEGHYDEEKTVASFVGFAPAENPRFVMLIKLREPTSSPWGSETAAPLWFAIAKDLFIRMGIAPSQ